MQVTEKHGKKTGAAIDNSSSKLLLVSSFSYSYRLCVFRPCSGAVELLMF